jgi:hypothetical protein
MEALILRAIAALAMAKQHGGKHVKYAWRAAASLEKQSAEARGHAKLIKASVAMLEGDAPAAGREARAAHDLFERLGMRIWSAAARRSWMLAEREMANVDRAHDGLSALGIKDPPRWLNVVTPGF